MVIGKLQLHGETAQEGNLMGHVQYMQKMGMGCYIVGFLKNGLP